jgi:hypothetical protein
VRIFQKKRRGSYSKAFKDNQKNNSQPAGVQKGENMLLCLVVWRAVAWARAAFETAKKWPSQGKPTQLLLVADRHTQFARGL